MNDTERMVAMPTADQEVLCILREIRDELRAIRAVITCPAHYTLNVTGEVTDDLLAQVNKAIRDSFPPSNLIGETLNAYPGF
jgi:2'-5' RNA ligase